MVSASPNFLFLPRPIRIVPALGEPALGTLAGLEGLALRERQSREPAIHLENSPADRLVVALVLSVHVRLPSDDLNIHLWDRKSIRYLA